MTKTQARKKIKAHLAKRSHQPVVVTRLTVKYWWRVLNVALFNSTLHPPEYIVCRNFKDYYGWCDLLDDGTVAIGIRLQMPTRLLMLATIAHEMIHQWQIANGHNNAHNTHFFAWKQTFNQLGLPLKVWIDNEREHRIHG